MVKVKENLEFQTIICPVTVIGWGAQGCLQLAGGDLAICAPATHLSLAYCLHLEFPGLTGEYDLKGVSKTSTRYTRIKDQSTA